MWLVLCNQNISIPFIIQWGPAPLHQDSEDDGDYDQKDDNAENTDGDDSTRVDFLLLTPGDVSILISSVRLMLIVRAGHYLRCRRGQPCRSCWPHSRPRWSDTRPAPGWCSLQHRDKCQQPAALPGHNTMVTTYQSRSYKIPADIDKKPQPATEQYKRW